MPSSRREIARQILSNQKALPHFESFRDHRARFTEILLPEAGTSSGDLCVLGAGNCYDLDLERLVHAYRRVHLVDIDPWALSAARDRLPASLRDKIAEHAPVDLSGCNDALERWHAMQVTPEELAAVPAMMCERICRVLPGPFHTVVSACLLSQLLLTTRRVMGERHALFEAACLVQTLGHLRTLVRLTAPEGRAWFVTDATSSEIAPLPEVPPERDLRPLLCELESKNQVFNALAPSAIAGLVRDDPWLSKESAPADPAAAWYWHNGPRDTFLVYAMQLPRRNP